MTKMDMEIELQKKQIEDFKRREDDALRREEKYKQREDQLLDRIKEAERHYGFRDTPPPSQHQDLPALQRSERSLLAETGMQTAKPCFSRKDIVPSHQHTYSSSRPAPSDSELSLSHFCTRNTSTVNVQGRDAAFPPQSALQKCYHGSSLVEETGPTCHCFPSLPNAAVQCPIIQTGDKTQSFSETNASIYSLPPTTSVSIAPVQKSACSTQCLPLAKSYSEERQIQLSTSFPITVGKLDPKISKLTIALVLTETSGDGNTFEKTVVRVTCTI